MNRYQGLLWLKGAIKALPLTAARRPRRQARSIPPTFESLEGRTVPAPLTFIWTGADGNLWSDPGDWTTLSPPVTGHVRPLSRDSLIFPPNAANLANVNDLGPLILTNVTLSGTGYDISGAALTLTNGLSDTAAGTNTIANAITVQGDQAFSVLAGAATLDLTGTISGSSALTTSGAGTLQLAGNSTYAGQITVSQGTLQVTGSLTVPAGGSIDDFGQVLVEGTAAAVTSVSTGGIGSSSNDTGPTASTPGGVALGGPAATLLDFGQVTIESGGGLTVEGVLTVEPKATLTDGGSLFVHNAQVQLPPPSVGGSGGGGGTLTVVVPPKEATLNDFGTVRITASGTLDDRALIRVERGPVVGTTPSPAGVLNVEGILTVEQNASLTDAGSVMVSEAGKLDDRGRLTIEAATGGLNGSVSQPAGSLAVDGRLTVEQNATLTDAGSVTVSSTGRLDDQGMLMVEPAAGGLGGSFSQPAGQLEVDGRLTVEQNATLTDAGNVTVSSTGGTLDDLGTVAIAPSGTLDGRGGSLVVESGASLTDSGTITVEQGFTLTDNGIMTIAAGGSVDDSGNVTVGTGGTLDDEGSFVIEASGTLDVRDGTFGGNAPTGPGHFLQ